MTRSVAGLVIGRYRLFEVIGTGGMASVHLARQSGGAGFYRNVAVKRLHPQHAANAEFATMFLDEARLASHVRHPNVVSTIDVVEDRSEILMVMELVEGATLTTLLRETSLAGVRLPLPVVSAIVSGMLRGLHAAHTAVGPLGMELGIIHRDVSPHNVMVGVDGVPRVLDFGVAKANGQTHATRHGEVRGKPAYMAPEHLREGATTLSDIYSAGVVLWECLAGERLFQSDSEGGLIARVLEGRIRRVPPATPPVPPALEAIALRALSREPTQRFETAQAMADALESVMRPAPPAEVARAVERWAGRQLADLRSALFEIDADDSQPMLPRQGPLPQVAAPQVAAAPRYLESVRPGFSPGRGAGEITLTGPTDRPAHAPVPAARPAPARARRPRRALWVLGSVGAGALAGLVLVVGLEQRDAARGASHTDAPSGVPTASPAPTEAPSASEMGTAPPTSTPSVSEPVVTPTESASATAEVDAPPSAARTVTKPAAVAPSVRTSAAVPPAASARADCDPPWELDQNGVQRVKVRCFKVTP